MQTVNNLNEKLYGVNGTDNLNHVFIYTQSGYVESISLSLCFEDYYIKINLWDDQNESRKFNEKTQEYESLEKHIIQKYKNVIKDMSKITKYLCK